LVLEIVNTGTTDLVHLTAVQVKWSGVHIGGGIYFSANHFPSAGGSHTATPQQGLPGAAESHATTEYDFTLPSGGSPWTAYREDLDGNGTPETILAGFDISLQVGDPLVSTGAFYDGPAAPMLIANDPNDLSGNVVITGYPEEDNSLNNTAGVLHQTTGTLAAGDYTEQNVSGDMGGFYTVEGAEPVGGMSGGGTFLSFDPDGDGSSHSYLIGVVVRGGEHTTPGGVVTGTYAESSSLSPHYAELAAAIESLSGADARTADDFARMVLMSAQSAGSSLTTVNGQFFHEDIFGGVNNDTLLGNGGNDSIFGRDGADTVNGGDGDDTLSGGTGADLFRGFGGGATDRITDFNAGDGDIVDLSSLFSDFSELLAAAAEQGDGSLLITLPAGAGGGSLVMEGTSLSDLTTSNTNLVCFCAGTLIATPDGQRAVEDLGLGDRVQTVEGRSVPVKWIGRQTVMTCFGPAERLMPVRFAAGSLGQGLPHTDLTVTADHGMLVEDVICHAGALVNGVTIHRVPLAEMGETYTVYHIETEGHEIILANGAPAETFIDNVSRRVFDNFAEFEALYGDVPEMEELPYPRAMSVRQVPDWVQRKLLPSKVA
jgi:hypothetical protein